MKLYDTTSETINRLDGLIEYYKYIVKSESSICDVYSGAEAIYVPAIVLCWSWDVKL